MDSPEIEEEYWSNSLENQPIKSVARQLLARIEYSANGVLLDLYPSHLRPLTEYFRTVAKRQLSFLDIDRQEKNEARNHPVLLTELAFEGQNKMEEAAALYALEHDLSLNGGAIYSDFVHWVLRYKLATSLDTLDTQETNTEQHIALVENVATTLKKTDGVEGIPMENLRAMKFHFYEWLGFLYNRTNNYQLANNAFLMASDNAPDFDLKMANLSLAADALYNAGEKQAAFQLIKSTEQDVDKILDKGTREQWETIYGRIRYELGAQGYGSAANFQTEPAQLIIETMESWLREEIPPDEAALEGFIDWLNRARGELDGSDACGQLKLVLGLLRVLSALEQPHQWQTLMREAEALEQQCGTPKLRLQRLLLLARQKTFTQPDDAITLFGTIWPEIQQHMKPEEQLAATGFYLEALGRRAHDETLPQILRLVSEFLALYRHLIDQQPGSPARRRIRETHQRALESAVLAMLTVAEQLDQESKTAQQILKNTWCLIMATRNPELTPSRNNHSPVQRDSIQNALEDEFHAGLRRVLYERQTDSSQWENKLIRLLDHELVQQPTKMDITMPTLPKQGIALAFFQFRELSSSRPHVILGSHRGRFWAQRLDQSGFHILRLQYWKESLASESPTADLQLEKSSAAMFLEASLLRTAQEEPWLLFPDAELNSIPLEMLPDIFSNKPLGVRHPVQIMLRSSIASSNTLNLTGGWLGLGGVPATGIANELLESMTEIKTIEKKLKCAGYPCGMLYGEEANAAQLFSAIKKMRPAVLHLAAHGIVSAKYPEACALVLAKDPHDPAGELLTFRRIQMSDLSGVELAVLSACSSGAGRSSRAAGLEGLVWAFLQAGVNQVIAARYSVSDSATARFMDHFYRHLSVKPAMKALQLTKRDCLLENMPFREVSAWGIWG